MAGLRLVSAILLSHLILGTSAVQTGVQVGCAELQLAGHGAKGECCGRAALAEHAVTGGTCPTVVSCPALVPACLPALPQFAGIAVTIASVTAFMWWSFRQAQRRQASAGAGAPSAIRAPSDSEAGGGAAADDVDNSKQEGPSGSKVGNGLIQ